MTALRELQLVEVKMLSDLVSYFEKHDIRYYALAGTMLGAVRHKGFVPWDDDIDIGVPREDYDRLVELARVEGNVAGLSVRYYPFDKLCMNYPMRVVNEKTLLTLKVGDSIEKENAWITIFPLDGMPSGAIKRSVHSRLLLWRRFAYVMARYRKIVDVNNYRYSRQKRFFVRLAGIIRADKLFSESNTFNEMTRDLKKYPFDKSDYIICLMGGYKLKELFPKSVFGNGAEYDYEGLKLRGPADYDSYLTQLYGDYMTPPDEDSPMRNRHGIVDIEIEE